jgi:hypothetical protein
MALQDLFRPRHRHSKAAVRRRAIEEVDSSDPLVELACTDDDLEVRLKAVRRLAGAGDQAALKRVALNGGHLDARLKAIAALEDQRTVAEVLKERKNLEMMMACFERIDDQSILAEIARDPAYNVTARRIAINMFADQELLVELLRSLRAPLLRKTAIEQIRDDDLRASLQAAEQDDGPGADERMDRILATYDAEVVAEFLGAFRDSPSAVRGLGVILGRGGTPAERAEEILRRILRHARPEMRLEAAEQLLPHVHGILPELEELAANDPDPMVRDELGALVRKATQGTGGGADDNDLGGG